MKKRLGKERLEKIDNDKLYENVISYKAHLYMIFLFSSGVYPLPLDANNSTIERFCQKLEDILVSEEFFDVVSKVEKIFDYCFNEWIKDGNSQFAVKEKKEFTELLLKVARQTFVNKTLKVEECKKNESEQWEDGEILSVRIKNGKWFAFIKTGVNIENVYFDKRAYDGEFKDLYPGVPVKFKCKIKRSSNGKEVSFVASKVECC